MATETRTRTSSSTPLAATTGITRVQDEETGKGRLTGDVDPAVASVAGHLSPNPGGVGPMTRAMLLANVVKAAELRLNR